MTGDVMKGEVVDYISVGENSVSIGFYSGKVVSIVAMPEVKISSGGIIQVVVRLDRYNTRGV